MDSLIEEIERHDKTISAVHEYTRDSVDERYAQYCACVSVFLNEFFNKVSKLTNRIHFDAMDGSYQVLFDNSVLFYTHTDVSSTNFCLRAADETIHCRSMYGECFAELEGKELVEKALYRAIERGIRFETYQKELEIMKSKGA